ncbi:MAG: LysR family transcriptional regulator [Akkermansiaceae bacterium]|nr:LysR family transcriptional regulator [Akkermansiaceae bacterium]
MELRHLRYFVAVAEELSFSRAAARLHVTRPALSKQIKDLEEQTGVRLLDRDTVRVSLTDAGAVFLAEAQAILSNVEEATRLAREAQNGRRGRLKIGSVGQISTSFLPEALKAFHHEFPDIEVTFAEMNPVDQLSALAAGQIHIGFAYGNDVEHMPGMDSLLLVRSTFGVSVSRHHPLATRETIRMAELSKDTFLFLGEESTSTHRRDIVQMFRDEAAFPGPSREISGFESLLTMIAADQGISMLPEILDLTKSHGIVTVPLDLSKAGADFTMWAVWRKNIDSLMVRNFIRLLETHRRKVA